MTSPATIDRVAKAIFIRPWGRPDEPTFVADAIIDARWSAIDESERTAYRLDAVAAIAAYTAGDER